jgi:hypothetical protein
MSLRAKWLYSWQRRVKRNVASSKQILPQFNIYIYIYILHYISLYIMVIVLFCVLFVCRCVLYYCHRVSTLFQVTNIPYHIYNIIYHVIYYIIITSHIRHNDSWPLESKTWLTSAGKAYPWMWCSDPWWLSVP